MKKLIFFSLIVVTVLSGRLNATTTLFSTFGPGDTYDVNSGWTVGSVHKWDQGDQFSFTGTNSYYLDTIELAVGFVNGTNELDVWLMSDAGGEPDTIIESFSFIGDMGTFGLANPLLVGNSVLHPLLTPDTPYWLIASVMDDTWAAWNYSEFLGKHAQRQDTGTWIVLDGMGLGAFHINGTSVIPAPGAIALGSIGVAFVGWLRRRRTL